MLRVLGQVSSVAWLCLLATRGAVDGAMLRTADPGDPDSPAPPPLAGQTRPAWYDHPVVKTLNDPCFYNHLGSCSPCVNSEGCGYCSDGHPAVKGKCMTGNEKGPLVHRGCSKWYYKVCKIPKVTPPYVPAVVEKPKEEPIVVPPRKADPVKLTPTKKPKLAPWNVKPESNKTAKVIRKENARKGARPHQPKKKAPHVEGFNMDSYINDIVAEETKTRKGLEIEKEEDLAPAKTDKEEKENEGADEGMEEMKEQIHGEELRTIRERKRLLEESWKRDNQRKTAQSIRVQERSEIVGERHTLKESGGVVGPLPDEANVVGKGEWAKKNKDQKASELSNLHNTRGFIKSAHYIKLFSHPNLEQSNVHLGKGNGDGKPVSKALYEEIGDATAEKREGLVASPMNPTTFTTFRNPVGSKLPTKNVKKVTLKDKNMTVYKHGGIDSEALAAEEEFLPSDDSRANATTSNKPGRK